MIITVHLAALTRVEYSEDIEVPDDITLEELDDVVQETWDKIDGGDFSEDPDYWEKGDCYWTEEEPYEGPE